jgi:hypothetical protein
MMCHFASGTWALFDEDMQNHMGTTGAQFMSYDRYAKTAHKDAFGSTFIVAGSAMKTSDLGGFANARLDLFGPRAARLHEARRARPYPAQRLRRGAAQPREPRRARRREGRARPADGKARPQLRSDATAVWNANFEEGLRIAKAAGAQESWSARGAMPTIHLMGGTIMGTGAANSVVDSYGRSHECRILYSPARHLRERGRLQPDLHHLRAFAARRRAPGQRSGCESRRNRTDHVLSERAR